MGKLLLNHPLEFKTALIFSALFVLFAALTSIVLTHFGDQGLHIMSFLVGLADIDPFILSLIGGSFQINETQIINAIIIATASNNLVKAFYVLVFGGRNRFTLAAVAWLVFLFILSIIYVEII